MLFLAFAILGLAGLVLAAFAWRSNRRFGASGAASQSWFRARRISRLAALSLAAASFFVSFPHRAESETYRVLGFPFVAAAFDEAGRDYVGPLTAPAMLANAVFFALLPQLALWFMARRRVVV